MTIDELAQIVGMSARNIRSHQARKRIPPPTRKGRVAVYDDRHVRRLETIVALQHQGFNLASIEAMLGVRGSAQSPVGLSGALERLTADAPELRRALSQHGVVGNAEDGTLRPARLHALRVALGLRGVGLSETAAVGLLVAALDELAPVAGRLAGDLGSQVLALTPEPPGDGTQSWERVYQQVAGLAQGVFELLVAAFRIAVENSAEAVVSELVSRRFGVDLDVDVDPALRFDTG